VQEHLVLVQNIQAQVATWSAQRGQGDASVLELPVDGGVGNLPFVNGLLLGYPFTYCVTADNVAAVGARLSSEKLLVFRSEL
jgi:hypothetical protein